LSYNCNKVLTSRRLNVPLRNERLKRGNYWGTKKFRCVGPDERRLAEVLAYVRNKKAQQMQAAQSSATE
jgi:hypothetical protein